MSRHEGVSCDSCSKSNFRGKRYKCLICFDYDLCSACFENGTTTTRHTSEHPMQCILTRSDFDLFFGGESLQFDHPSSYSFVCPYCGKLGLNESQLSEHVSADHSCAGVEVICPICAALPGGDPNHVTDDLSSHLSMEHRATNRELEEPLSRNIRRIFHPVRNIPPPRSSRRAQQMATSSSSMSPSSSVSPATYSSARENIDPIAELLSQLSGVRRAAQQQSAAETATQLQILQQQLQLERQQVQHAREKLERLPRKQPTPAQTSKETPKAATPAVVDDSDRYLLTSYFDDPLPAEEEATRRREQERRSLFCRELVWDLIRPELESAAPQTTSEKTDNQREHAQSVSASTTVSESNFDSRSGPKVASASGFATRVASNQYDSLSDSVENMVLTKQCSTAEAVVTFLSDSDEPNHNSPPIS